MLKLIILFPNIFYCQCKIKGMHILIYRNSIYEVFTHCKVLVETFLAVIFYTSIPGNCLYFGKEDKNPL